MTSDGTASVAPAADWGMVGQEHAVAALRAAIASDRLAHAYLFNGPRGVGRATLARRLAQALSCEEAVAGAPCFECRACRQIGADAWPDVEHITIGGVCDVGDHRDHAADGSTRIRICQVRRLERVASLAPLRSPRRIFVIDTADDLQTEAGHALLKTLEEPPATALVVLLASNVEELLPTVRSRCQELTLRPASLPALTAALAERTDVAADEAASLARLAGGRFGLALELQRDPSLQVLRESVRADIAQLVTASRNERFDYARTLSGRWGREREAVLAALDVWRDAWREVLHAAVGLEAASADVACTPAEATRALSAVQTARDHLLDNTNPQLALEVMLLDLPLLADGSVRDGRQGEEARTAAVTA